MQKNVLLLVFFLEFECSFLRKLIYLAMLLFVTIQQNFFQTFEMGIIEIEFSKVFSCDHFLLMSFWSENVSVKAQTRIIDSNFIK
jgi:hypothetical protein